MDTEALHIRERTTPEPLERRLREGADQHADVSALALLARACGDQGRLTGTRQRCEKGLAADKLNAGMHYLHATILQEQGALAMQNIQQASAKQTESAAQSLHDLGQKLKLLVKQNTVEQTRHPMHDVTPAGAC